MGKIIQITGVISFLISIFGIAFSLAGVFSVLTKEGEDIGELLTIILILISGSSIALYVYLTKLGNITEVEKIERENLLLEKQIEQKELKRKLAD